MDDAVGVQGVGLGLGLGLRDTQVFLLQLLLEARNVVALSIVARNLTDTVKFYNLICLRHTEIKSIQLLRGNYNEMRYKAAGAKRESRRSASERLKNTAPKAEA